MSEVKRFYAGELSSHEYVIRAADVDRVTAELDALQKRVDLLEGLLRNVRNKLSFGPDDTKAIDAALRKSAEGGGDEK